MSNQLIQQTANLPELFYKDQPVLTTELLAKAFGVGQNNIQQNYKRNQERFEEGKHFFKVQGEELRAFSGVTDLKSVAKRVRINEVDSQISPKTRTLILWTQRGAARHAKLISTDQAWEVFELLEDSYFNRSPFAVVQGVGVESKRMKFSKIERTFLSAKRLAKSAGLSERQSQAKANDMTKETLGVDVFELLGLPTPGAGEAQAFLKLLDDLIEAGEVANLATHEGQIAVRMDSVWAPMKAKGQNYGPEIYDSLKQHPRFLASNKTVNNKKTPKAARCWLFERGTGAK